MLTIINPVAVIPSAYDPDRDDERTHAVERLEDAIHTWDIEALFAALPRRRRMVLEELISEAAEHLYDTATPDFHEPEHTHAYP